MSKKMIVFMSIICIGLGAFVFYMNLQTDRKGPEITIDESGLAVYRDGMTDAKLLEGVTAIDEKNGDVSDSLAVESVYHLNETEVVITYAAKDNENNITKLKRTIKAEPESSEYMDVPEKDEAAKDEVSEEKSEIADTISEDSGEETEDKKEITPTPSEKSDKEKAEEMKAEQEKITDSLPATSPRIYLTEYYVKLPVGSKWDAVSYVKEIVDDADDMYALWRKIQITDEVNTATAGTYTCTYYIVDSQNNVSNNATLTVVVE